MGTPAGGQTLALGTARLMEKYPGHVFIQDDIENIFGAAIRKTGVETYSQILVEANGTKSPILRTAP